MLLYSGSHKIEDSYTGSQAAQLCGPRFEAEKFEAEIGGLGHANLIYLATNEHGAAQREDRRTFILL
jgi:hypothetical protein